MPSPFLYSVSTVFSVQVANRYRGGVFYAWCSEAFSAGQQPGQAPAAMVAPSSDPSVIYEQLHRAVVKEDRHDARMKSYRRTFKRLADDWFSRGEITKYQRDELVTNCQQNSFRMWSPLLFIISRDLVEARLKKVPATKRAGPGDEFIIADMTSSEFDIIELPVLIK